MVTQEPRQRFQSATANVTVRNVVSNSFRRASLERQKRLSQNSSTSSQLSRGNSSDQWVFCLFQMFFQKSENNYKLVVNEKQVWAIHKLSPCVSMFSEYTQLVTWEDMILLKCYILTLKISVVLSPLRLCKSVLKYFKIMLIYKLSNDIKKWRVLKIYSQEKAFECINCDQ